MNKVIYRDLLESDYETIKELIGEAFGFYDFIKDEALLNIVLSGYLQECILDTSFCKVAQKNGKVIGFILGSALNDKTRVINSVNNFNFDISSIKSIMNNKTNHTLIKEFLKIQNTYKEILKDKECQFQGCIQLFIVSKESRGLGIGKALVKYLSDYMKSMNVKSFYLFTDSRCNYGFYDSQNFSRINEKEVSLDYLNTKLNVFLYGYEF
ncbi:GNAT family N-acetyltransferase [Romboutsia sp. 1001713B170207_170306_H8]|uniref:GNAT family N-acetyltransferase n=1 Tax=Romboutsia sp. 1001713B170207_170306_H8 TaxID=2787112 RepID=UPI0008225B75|nr:GNAT family N-acetyltransferase [Romboutsia sp. 1001713B170207_170306_H8]SCH85422.1 Predicted acetyltransferase [uncultured Clostridium sp.]